MKKSLMPCERRDLSSVTPDEPASGGLRGKGECQTSGYIHSSPKKASHTTSTPIEPIGQCIHIPDSRTRIFLIADRRKNRRLIRRREWNLSRNPCIWRFRYNLIDLFMVQWYNLIALIDGEKGMKVNYIDIEEESLKGGNKNIFLMFIFYLFQIKLIWSKNKTIRNALNRRNV